MFHWKNLSFQNVRFDFKVRNKQRDERVDAERFAMLEDAFKCVIDGIEKEKSGLQQRYQEATMGAASLAVAEENAEAPSGSNERIEDLTKQIIAYDNRMKKLAEIGHQIWQLDASLKSVRTQFFNT